MPVPTSMINAREAAYLALLTCLRQEGFIAQFLEKWQNDHKPSSSDFGFAQEIAFGAARQALSLDYLAASLSAKGKLNIKLKERALLRAALYQHYFMSKVPLYAICNETIHIAKKHCHSSFVSYLNALLRRLGDSTPTLPQGNTTQDLSIRFSYPQNFIHDLMQHYGLDSTLAILQAGNTPSQTMMRIRTGNPLATGLSHVKDAPIPMALLNDSSALGAISAMPDYYIQNITPAALVAELSTHTPTPQNILDLCASPGGKLIAAHDQFPKAALFGNDVSDNKLKRLLQNVAKYDINITLSCGLGEEFTSDSRFDLIILDVPCSNSGVLNKRPEARWRMTPQALKSLEGQQMRLLQHASTLLSPKGCIWYLTCSILPQENEKIIKSFCQTSSLTPVLTKTILPNQAGWDGGFACLLRHHPNELSMVF